MTTDIPCVILSGGKSSRMKEDIGIDKAHLDFWGEPLYLRQFQKLSQIFSNVYLSTKKSTLFNKIPQSNIIEDLEVVYGTDTTELFAPTLGMLSAFEKLQSERIFFLGVDTPFISEISIKKLLQKKLRAVAAIHQGKIHPTVGAYNKNISPELEEMIKKNKHKLTLLLEKIGTIFVDVEDGSELANLNRYEDYEKAINSGINPFR